MNQTHFEGPRILALPTKMSSTTMRAQAPGESNDRASRIDDEGKPEKHPPAPPPPPGIPRHPAEVPLDDPAVEPPLILDDPDTAEPPTKTKTAKGRKH